MKPVRRVIDVIRKLPGAKAPRFNAPAYNPNSENTDRVFLALESFSRHMTDEGWQFQIGSELAGYQLWGPGFDKGRSCGDVAKILAYTKPGVVVVQDKREWDPDNHACLDKGRDFKQLDVLRNRDDIFRVTLLKDLQNHAEYQRQFHWEIGAHAVVVYYHPDIACHLCPWLRKEHLVRTYHTIDSTKVPRFNAERRTCLFSGAVGKAYPLRERIAKWLKEKRLDQVDKLEHPGYHSQGTHSNDYLQTLNRYRVAICTSSRYGYALRKIIEATACGCRVITDLPTDDVLPEIDGNLIRISPDCSTSELSLAITRASNSYNSSQQQAFAEGCKAYYDYRAMGLRTAKKIEDLRLNWANKPPTGTAGIVQPGGPLVAVTRARPVTVVVNKNYRPTRK